MEGPIAAKSTVKYVAEKDKERRGLSDGGIKPEEGRLRPNAA